MWVIVNKKANSNQWDYPDTLTLFIDSFSLPGSKLASRYVGDKTLEELGLDEYTGELPTDEEPIRIVTVGSFKRRFGADVRKLIRESAIDAIIDMREDMDLALYVDLDDPYTVAGVNGIGPNGLAWLDNQGMADMLKNGTDREKYNGVL